MLRACFVLVVLAPVLASAASPAEVKQAVTIQKELVELQAAGRSLHRSYKKTDQDQMKACVDKSTLLRTRAAKVKKQVQDVDPFFRIELVTAADAAFQCVSCGNDGRACDQITPELQALDAKVKRSEVPARSVTSADKW